MEKTHPIKKTVRFTAQEWLAIRKWIQAQRPKISESEALRRFVVDGVLIERKLDKLEASEVAEAMRQESERA